MFNLIFSQLHINAAGGGNLISTAFNQPLPKLYAISMMWTLNARKEIRTVRARLNSPTSSERTEHNLFSTRVGAVQRVSTV